MAVKVQFEIGHTSKLRSKKTVEGFTHDWELYVKGSQQADISAFVEKIVFILHESFPKPKRVCKEPPYVIHESGYAGFIVFIEIYFRNRDEPKRVSYTYDLDLQQTGPPKHRCEVRKHIFENPTEEFRQKLLRAGGVPVSGVLASNALQNSSVPAITGGPTAAHPDIHKNMSSEKKHKSRPPDDAKLNSFANLFGPPITKTSAGNVGGVAAAGGVGVVASSYTSAANSKHSPDTKTVQQVTNSGNNLHPPKEKSSKDKEKSSSEKSKERSERKEKHHKQSGASPHKEGRSESKKSESKHEKRDKNEEKSKKDKNRDKDRDRDREKSSSGSTTNATTSNNKKNTSPKPSREISPHKTVAVSASAAPAPSLVNNSNTLVRPSSSQGGKLDEVKSSSKSSKDSSSKDSKQKESSSSSSGKKSKKEKKDKDKDRDKERRHEEKEKQKVLDASSKAASKDDTKLSLPPNNINSNSSATVPTPGDTKQTKIALSSASHPEISKKSSKPDTAKLTEKVIGNSVAQPPALATSLPPPSLPPPAINDKKPSSSTGSSSSAAPEKDKRSHKHKKKEKNKDKDKDRERDKERDKDKDKDREKDKDKESKREKESKEKIVDEKNSENFSVPPPLQQTLASNTANITNSPRVSNPEESPGVSTTPSSTTSSTTTTTSSSSKSSKNKEKKSKDKSSKEDKLKHKSNDPDATETKNKQPKLSSSSSTNNNTNNTTIIPITTTNPPIPPPINTSSTTISASNSTHLDLSDNDSVSSTPLEPITTPTTAIATISSQTSNPVKQPLIITHSDSSNSSFPDLTIPKTQKPTSQELAKPVNPTPPPLKDPPPKVSKSSKDKTSSSDKSSKDEEKDKKRRRNSQAANTFIEPPLKQMKKETKSVREKSKSPSLRNTGSRASISEATPTFLQPGASPSSTAAAAPLPPPSSAAHSPALSAAEAVGNATSATANAATCNSNSSNPTSNTNSLAAHQLPLDYLSELQELHHKIMTLQDNEDLQHVVEMIAATGCYEITTKTFDFDLCKLDRVTVQRLQEFFATSVS